MKRWTVLALAGLTLAGCEDDPVAPEATGEVAVRFATPSPAGGSSVEGPANVVVVGSNGTLEIDDVHVIVGEFELEGADDACIEVDDGEEELEDCEEFEAPPFFLDLPLEGNSTTVVTADVPAGAYTGFEFEVEDVDFDEDDEDEQEILAVRDEALALHADWPDGASMVVEGTFTPDVGTPRTFRVFVDAEIEVEAAFDQTLTVAENGTSAITVVLDPALWFSNADGTVIDLSLWDFTEGGDLLELEAEIENGVVRVEIEDD